MIWRTEKLKVCVLSWPIIWQEIVIIDYIPVVEPTKNECSRMDRNTNAKEETKNLSRFKSRDQGAFTLQQLEPIQAWGCS